MSTARRTFTPIWSHLDRGLILLIAGALLLIVAGLASLVLWSGRAPALAPAESPEGVVQRFYQAAYQSDYAAAHALLSASEQRRISADELRDRLGDTLRQSQTYVGAATVHADSAVVPVTQTHYAQGGPFGPDQWSSSDEAVLTRESGDWKIADWGFAFW